MFDIRLSLAPLGVAAVMASPVVAQTPAELTGAWTGSIVTPAGMTSLTLKIDTQGRAVMDATALGMTDIPVEGPTVESGVVRFSIPSLGGSFEGRLSDDRKTLTGSLQRGQGTMPLVFTHAPLPVA